MSINVIIIIARESGMRLSQTIDGVCSPRRHWWASNDDPDSPIGTSMEMVAHSGRHWKKKQLCGIQTGSSRRCHHFLQPEMFSASLNWWGSQVITSMEVRVHRKCRHQNFGLTSSQEFRTEIDIHWKSLAVLACVFMLWIAATHWCYLGFGSGSIQDTSGWELPIPL